MTDKMNKEHKEVLRKVLGDFMEELGHLDLVVHLLQLYGVLNDSDRERILNQPGISQKEKVRKLLEKLTEKGPNAFGSFVKALNLHQQRLATRLQTELVLSNVQVKEVFMAKLKDIGGVVSDLYSRYALSDENKSKILEQYTTKEKQVEELLRILPSTGPDVLEIFTDVLTSRQENDLVSVLQEKKEEVERSLAESHAIPSETKSAAHKKLEEECEILKTTHCSEVKNLQDRISRLAKEKKELEEARENESAAHEKLKHDYVGLTAIYSRDTENLRDSISFLEEELNKVEEARENESVVYQKLENDYQSQAKHLEEVEDAWKNETMANERLEANNSFLAKELDEVKKARDEVKLKNEKLKNKYSMLKTTHCSEVESLKLRISFLEKEVKEARENEYVVYQKLENDHKSQAKHLEEVEDAWKNETAAHKDLKANNSRLSKELDEVKKARDEESAAHKKLKNDYVMLKKSTKK